MNFIDILICIPVAWGLYKGFTKGLVIEAGSIAAFFLGVWCATSFSDDVKPVFSFAGKYDAVVAFVVLFLGAVALIFLTSKLINEVVEGASLSSVNKLAGSAFGALKFALIISVLFFVMDAVEKSYPMLSVKSKEESLLYKPVAAIAPTIIPGLNQEKMQKMMPQAPRSAEALREGEEVKVEISQKANGH